MKLPFYALAAVLLAFTTQSCMTYTEKVYTASGYDARDSYNLGYKHGSADRVAGRAHNPHINMPFETPAAYRQDYIWGYTQGYRAQVSGSK
ncbi:hypothetical protein HAHE_12890 [Haloferula helveola]|uniref:Uncharacterized protein n=1 Tax=Haloferula helveola TaxID=490095 RepID=A0ABM7REP0_9BACT|nr:hypothetical protein HAHE_12890 [Haloferula helveola]